MHVDSIVHCLPLPFSTSQKIHFQKLDHSPMMSFCKSHCIDRLVVTGTILSNRLRFINILSFRYVVHRLSQFQDCTHVYCLDSWTALMYTHVIVLDRNKYYSVVYFKCTIEFDSLAVVLSSLLLRVGFIRASWDA